MITDKKRVRILLRVSSDQQLEEDGDLMVQRQLVCDYVKEHANWLLDEKEYFEGSKSGYKNSVADREVLQEAYQDAKNHEYDILVVYKDDRIGRRMWEIGGYIMSLKSLGVNIYTVKDGCISPESNDIMGQMMLALRYGNAQKSSADTGMRVKDTAKKLAAQGKFMGGRAPYGYTLEHSGEISKHGRALKHLVIAPEQAEVVKYIYKLSLNRELGSAKIAKTLNNSALYKSLAPNDVWKSGTITSILTNPIYAGYTSYKRREHSSGSCHRLDRRDWIVAERQNPDIVIVDKDTWTNVQKKRKQRANKYTKPLKKEDVTIIGRNDGMLSLVDVLHCGYCGCKMVNGSKYNYWTIKSTGERRTSKLPIYKCQNAWQGIPHDKTSQFRADQIEPVIHELVAEYISRLQEKVNIFDEISYEINEEKQRKSKDLARAREELDKIRQNIQIIEEHIPDAMTGQYILSLKDLAHTIENQKAKEQKQITMIEQKIASIQNTTLSAEDWQNIKHKIPTWRELFFRADTPTKRVLVNKLIERIDITGEQIAVRLRVSPGNLMPQSRMTGDGVVPQQGV